MKKTRNSYIKKKGLYSKSHLIVSKLRSHKMIMTGLFNN
jgi:hypothetical protein